MSEILDHQITPLCPACGRQLQVTLRQVAQGRTVTCPGGHQVTLQNTGDSLQEADAALDDLKATIRRMGGEVG